jgi:hypothetical protein
MKTRQNEAPISREPPRSGAVFPHGNKTRTASLMCVDGGLQCGGRTGTAEPNHASSQDRATIAGSHGQLRPNAAEAECRRGGSGRDHHRPTGRAARRQTGALGRRIVSSGRRRSRNARAGAGHRQDARDSATRQPRRRPINPAEIALFCRCLAGPSALLDRSASHSLYAARSRMRYGVPRG